MEDKTFRETGHPVSHGVAGYDSTADLREEIRKMDLLIAEWKAIRKLKAQLVSSRRR